MGTGSVINSGPRTCIGSSSRNLLRTAKLLSIASCQNNIFLSASNKWPMDLEALSAAELKHVDPEGGFDRPQEKMRMQSMSRQPSTQDPATYLTMERTGANEPRASDRFHYVDESMLDHEQYVEVACLAVKIHQSS